MKATDPHNILKLLEFYAKELDATQHSVRALWERLTALEAKTQRFKKPTFEEVQQQASNIGLPASECERFINHYEANGWKVGKVPMKSWPHALSNWKKNYEERKNYGRPGAQNDRNAHCYGDTQEQARKIREVLDRRAREEAEAESKRQRVAT